MEINTCSIPHINTLLLFFFIIVEGFPTSLQVFVGPVHFMTFNLLPIALFMLTLFGIALE